MKLLKPHLMIKNRKNSQPTCWNKARIFLCNWNFQWRIIGLSRHKFRPIDRLRRQRRCDLPWTVQCYTFQLVWRECHVPDVEVCQLSNKISDWKVRLKCRPNVLRQFWISSKLSRSAIDQETNCRIVDSETKRFPIPVANKNFTTEL